MSRTSRDETVYEIESTLSRADSISFYAIYLTDPEWRFAIIAYR